ncbi:hypothetical protein SLA2020_232680 [Shorea laevis]
MASEREDFSLSGPSHLTCCINWENADHRRSVLACLVMGVYTAARDRHEKREGSQALAPPWWESFHFKLVDLLVDAANLSIFGAIYEYKPSSSHYNDSTGQTPRYVIAFRGTLKKRATFVRDFWLNFRVFRCELHQTSRFEIAMQAVRNMVAAVGDSNVWLAGHSLGAALAMLAGRAMAKRGIRLESFLFNPPFVSVVPIERIKNRTWKLGIRFARSVITAALALALEPKNLNQGNVSEDPFPALSQWFPCLFVNPADLICSEYIGYFEHRREMEKIGAECIEKIATQHSFRGLVKTFRGLLKRLVGKDSEAAEPFHLIPSADLTVNQTRTENFKDAHGIRQWWTRDLHLHSKRYRYR